MRSHSRTLAAIALAIAAFAAAPAPARATVVHYKTGWSAPRAHYRSATTGTWTAVPGVAMRAEGGGWFAADTGAVAVSSVVFNDGLGHWDNAPGGANYENALGASELWVFWGALTYAPPEPGTIEEANLPSPVLGRSRHVRVYLPAWYARQTARRYPVLYLQDGQNLFDPSAIWGGWAAGAAVEQASRAGTCEPVIIVGIDNSPSRMTEYTPVYDSSVRAGGGAARYLDFIERDLKPWIDARYRTRPDAASTGIGGSSLGGLLALYAGLYRPSAYGRVLAMSPSLWWGNRWLIGQVQSMPRVPAIRVYIDSGGPQDGSANVITMRDLLAARGLRLNSTLWYRYDPQGQHNETYWRARLPKALGDLFPR